jgi:opacity protein-like surface antigen
MGSLNGLRRRLAASMLLFLVASPAAILAQYAQPPGPPPPGYGGQGGWDAPPSEYSEIQRKGFQQGIEGARKDYENHREPNVNNRDEYRHPNVPKGFREDYRAAFARGYDVGVRHMMGR